jgi:hypothetical protein
MATKKFKTYCRIIDYVDAVDSELAELIRGTCVDLTLGSTKGKPGITFLMPQDKALRKKLADLAYSDQVEDANKASDMFNAMIFRDVFKSPSDWMAKKDDIPNCLLPSQHVELDSVSGKEVVFKSGARAVIDDGFKDASRKTNLAVWKLVSGEIPVTTDKPSKLKYAKMNKGKTGGYDVSAQMSSSERYKIATAIENAYVLHQLQKGTGIDVSSRDIYFEYTMSLINYIINVRKDTAVMYEKVLPLISLDKLDFYLLVEPHKYGGNYLLDDGLIQEWWLQKGAHPHNPKDVRLQIEELLKSGTGALVYTNRDQLLGKIADIRCQLAQYIDGRPRNCVDEIAKVYEQLEKSNSIGGLGPVFPAQLAAHYQNEPGLKMIQDELRYLTYGAFKSLESEPMFDQGRFHEITNMIGDCLFAATEDERAKQQKLLNKNSIKYLISPTEKIGEIRVFLYSTMFMYIPLTESEAMNLKQKHSIRRPDPQNIVVFNIAKDLFIQQNRIESTQSAPAEQSAMDYLRNLDFASLGESFKEELKRKLGF